MDTTLTERALDSGGKLSPLIVDKSMTRGLSLCNPSILMDGDNILVNIRNVSYVLHHCEGDMKFQTRWGPLNYVRPDNDATLRTINFLASIEEDKVKDAFQVETKKFDKKTLWEFIGLEDARLVRWNDKLYLCGCRRDVNYDGESRMELSEIKIDGNKVKEISRIRIPTPQDSDSYCEKNWVPILDMPYHFIKWTNPTEVVKVDPTPVKN